MAHSAALVARSQSMLIRFPGSMNSGSIKTKTRSIGPSISSFSRNMRVSGMGGTSSPSLSRHVAGGGLSGDYVVAKIGTVAGRPQSPRMTSHLSSSSLSRLESSRWMSMRGKNIEMVVAKARGRRALQELLDRRDEELDEKLSSAPKVTKLEWNSPLEILKYPHPKLRAANAEIGCFDESLRKLSEEMFEIMYQDDGVGLAAPQVGVNVRLMVFNETGEKERKDAEVVLVNPRIVSTSSDKKVFEEGCLSFPGMYADVIRPSKVRVSAQDLSGKRFTINISAFPARIFQHEYDHLQGVLFCDRWVSEGMEQHRNELVDMEDKYMEQHPNEVIQRIG